MLGARASESLISFFLLDTEDSAYAGLLSKKGGRISWLASATAAVTETGGKRAEDKDKDNVDGTMSSLFNTPTFVIVPDVN